MEVLSEWIESLMLDTGLEGVATAAGIGMLWGCFFGGGYALFHGFLELLASTV